MRHGEEDVFRVERQLAELPEKDLASARAFVRGSQQPFDVTKEDVGSDLHTSLCEILRWIAPKSSRLCA